MNSLTTLLFLVFLGFSRVIRAEEDHDDTGVASTDRLSISTDQLPTMELSTLTNIAISAGAAALGVAGLALVAYVILYIFGVKMCHLLGTCDALAAATAHFSNPSMSSVGVSSGHYSSQLENSPYGAYGAVQQPNSPPPSYQHEGNSFSKRSLEYVGPVLKNLAAAYDKYERMGQ